MLVVSVVLSTLRDSITIMIIMILFFLLVEMFRDFLQNAARLLLL